MKTHLNFSTEDIPKSVEFYSVLLDAAPAKLRSGYALFITEQPPLELALDAVRHARRETGDHYGIYVDGVDDVERAIRRLEQAGFDSSIEREQTCCYAKQTKVWTTDPTGRRWEIYTVHEETPERDAADTTCCTAS